MSDTFNPLREAEELREQLGSDKRRLIVFLGAGASQAVGIDGVAQLTAHVRADLGTSNQNHYDRLLNEAGTPATVEGVLDRVRLCREMIGEDLERTAGGLKGKEAVELDRAICSSIYQRVKIQPPKGLKVHADFAAWLASIERARPVEIFSTNYDLLIERGLEIAGAPYFDGFIGSVEPYFSDAAVDPDDDLSSSSNIPRRWIRLWKLHGSIGWRPKVEPVTGARRTLRVPLAEPSSNEDVMIFPSREKYLDSRRLPFVALHDRLRRITANGECLLLVIGYSFSDQHINDIFFGNLRANNRFSLTALMFDRLDKPAIQQNLLKAAQGIRNLTAYGPDRALVGGTLHEWAHPPQPPAGVTKWPFWDDTKKEFALGDFANLPTFLQQFIGARPLPAATPTG
jgi:hypothetical protein